MDTIMWQSLGRAVGVQEGNGSSKHVSPPGGGQEPVGVPGEATAATTATHPEDTALVLVRPALRTETVFGLLGLFRETLLPLLFSQDMLSQPALPCPLGSPPILQPALPGTQPSPPPPRPAFTTWLYTQLTNKLLLSHLAWPAWFRYVPKVAWAHVARGHLLLLLHGRHPRPQASALLCAGVTASQSPRISLAP